MKRIVMAILSLAAALALTTAALAAEFDPQLTVTSYSDRLVVTLVNTAENNAILVARQPTLSVPCSGTAVSVVAPDGKTIDFAQADGMVGFTVTAGGTYLIMLQNTVAGGISGGTASAGNTMRNPDGSTTRTETRADGSTVETTTAPGGTTAITVTGNDGSVSERAVTVSAADAASGSTVTLPIALSAADEPRLTITVPEGAGAVAVEIPVSAANSGTVAVIVHEDGTEEIVTGTVQTEIGVKIRVQGSVTVKIVDRSVEFDDTKDHWSRDEVNFAVARGLFRGVGGSHFDVAAPMTRAMTLTVLARLAGVDTGSGANWSAAGIDWAQRNNISDGSTANSPVTREQLVTMLYRFAGSPAVSGTLSFGDAHEVSDWARDAMLWATQSGILTGMDGNLLAPGASAERAQVAAIFARFLRLSA